MHCVTKLMRVGGSVTMVIPPIVMKEMKLLPNESVVISYNEKQMNINKLNDILKDKDKIEKG